ncbi:MAG: hypothetical protein KGL53_16380, partial [Elusimicrobia bacterium]|nr:hypothetical protein [Elusimicrobiota bacterium]
MRALLVLLAAAPAFAGGAAANGDIAARYQAARQARDAAAARLAADQQAVADAGNSTLQRLAAARAVEKDRAVLSAADAQLQGVLKQVKPGDAVWLQETQPGTTADPDRYQLRIPDIGAGVPADPAGEGVGVQQEADRPLPPLRGLDAPGGGSVTRIPPPGSVSYDLPAGFANGMLKGGEPSGGRLPVVSMPGEAGRGGGQAPPQEGVPFAGPVPPAVLRTG